MAERSPRLVLPRLPRLPRLALASVACVALAVPASGLAVTGASASGTAVTRQPVSTATNPTAGASQALAGASAAAKSAAQTDAAKTKAAKAKVAAKRRATKPAPPLTGWLAGDVKFPDRALVLFAPPGTALAPGQIRVAENGTPVSSLTLTPVARAAAGDFGVMFVVDQSSSMAGAPLTAAMNAVRGFAAQRVAAQEVGLMAFSASPNLILPLSSDQKSIDTELAQSLETRSGADVPAATTLALSQLVKAKVALGAIIVISDGVGRLTSAAGPSAASVQAAAAAAQVPIYTIGLGDSASSPASVAALQAASPGQFTPSTQTGLPQVLQSISSALMRGYIVRYRSQERPGQRATVTATAPPVPGAVDVGYLAPAAAPVVHAAPRASAAPVRRQSGPDFSGTSLLSAQPSFVDQVSPPAPSTPTTEAQGGLPTPLLAGLFGVLIALAIMLAVHRPKRAVRSRVLSSIPDVDSGRPGVALDVPTGRRVLQMLERRSWWSPFVENVEIARGGHTPIALVKRAAAAGAVAGVLVALVSGTLALGLLPLLLWPIPLKMFVARGARKQRAIFADSLPGYLQDLASALRVGRSFAGALAVVADTADEPVRSELERAVTDEALGRPLEESLVAVAARMQATDMDQVALIAALNSRSGSNVAEALDRVADGARDRADMRREVKALTGQAKMSSSVLTAMPPLLLIFISFISPSYSRPLFHTTLGIVMLVISALMVMAGWKVMKKISTIKA